MHAWLDRLRPYLADDAHLWARLWSVRIAIFWAIFSGLWVALPAFTYWVPAPVFALLCVFFALAILVARLTNQPGLI